VTRSEFFRALDDEFGHTQGRALIRDLVIATLGHRSALQALDEGAPPKDVWMALCEAMEVPLPRRHGAGRPEPVSDTPTAPFEYSFE
jgi:hypothetical protein